MAQINLDNPHYDITNEYWDLVRKTLTQIFDAGEEALEAMNCLQEEIDRTPSSEQSCFYHAEPLDVAADLAQKSEITDSQIQAYIKIRSTWSPGSSPMPMPSTSP